MLRPRQKKCIELLITGNLTQADVARELKITEQTICNWKKDPEFCAELERLTREKLRGMAPRAARVLGELLSSESDNVRLNAARDILDRAGFKAEEKLTLSGTLNPEMTKLDLMIKQMGEDGE